MKAIVLAGGKGSRLLPATQVVSKHLLPVYDKPMIYYPLSVLLEAGIQDILLIATPDDLPQYQKLLGDGSRIGVNLSYLPQYQPRGIAEAFIIAESFIAGQRVCLILGDNIFYGESLASTLSKAAGLTNGAVIFGYQVDNPSAYGVAELSQSGDVVSLHEKPEQPKSSYAVPGLYFYDEQVTRIARSLEVSKRGELEITAVNNAYLAKQQLALLQFAEDVFWLDAGTPDNLLEAKNWVRSILEEKGVCPGCLEVAAWKRGLITKQQLYEQGLAMRESSYGQYILSLTDN